MAKRLRKSTSSSFPAWVPLENSADDDDEDARPKKRVRVSLRDLVPQSHTPPSPIASRERTKKRRDGSVTFDTAGPQASTPPVYSMDDDYTCTQQQSDISFADILARPFPGAHMVDAMGKISPRAQMKLTASLAIVRVFPNTNKQGLRSFLIQWQTFVRSREALVTRMLRMGENTLQAEPIMNYTQDAELEQWLADLLKDLGAYGETCFV